MLLLYINIMKTRFGNPPNKWNVLNRFPPNAVLTRNIARDLGVHWQELVGIFHCETRHSLGSWLSILHNFRHDYLHARRTASPTMCIPGCRLVKPDEAKYSLCFSYLWLSDAAKPPQNPAIPPKSTFPLDFGISGKSSKWLKSVLFVPSYPHNSDLHLM